MHLVEVPSFCSRTGAVQSGSRVRLRATRFGETGSDFARTRRPPPRFALRWTSRRERLVRVGARGEVGVEQREAELPSSPERFIEPNEPEHLSRSSIVSSADRI